MKIIAIIALASLLILSACISPHEYEEYKEDIYGEDIEKCIMPAGIACLDFSTQGDDVLLVLQNGMGVDIVINSLSIEDEYLGRDVSRECTDFDYVGQDISLINGEKARFVCGDAINEAMIEARIVLEYTNLQTGLVHTKEGEIVVKMDNYVG